jgi:hypothetical protein
MRIVTDFETNYLLSRHRRGDPLIFVIYWEYDGVCYPETGWTDFGAVILVWWLEATRRLRDEGVAEVIYRFMDGPYGLRARREVATDNVVIEPEDPADGGFAWTIPLDHLIAELLQAAGMVRDNLAHLCIAERDQHSLEFCANRLR